MGVGALNLHFFVVASSATAYKKLLNSHFYCNLSKNIFKVVVASVARLSSA